MNGSGNQGRGGTRGGRRGGIQKNSSRGGQNRGNASTRGRNTPRRGGKPFSDRVRVLLAEAADLAEGYEQEESHDNDQEMVNTIEPSQPENPPAERQEDEDLIDFSVGLEENTEVSFLSQSKLKQADINTKTDGLISLSGLLMVEEHEATSTEVAGDSLSNS